MSERVLFEDIVPYDVPNALADLRGPESGAMVLPHSIYWAPDRRVDLDTEDGRTLAYRAIVREGTAAQQAELLNPKLLIEVWAELGLPTRCRAIWESRFPQLVD